MENPTSQSLHALVYCCMIIQLILTCFPEYEAGEDEEYEEENETAEGSQEEDGNKSLSEDEVRFSRNNFTHKYN